MTRTAALAVTLLMTSTAAAQEPSEVLPVIPTSEKCTRTLCFTAVDTGPGSPGTPPQEECYCQTAPPPGDDGRCDFSGPLPTEPGSCENDAGNGSKSQDGGGLKNDADPRALKPGRPALPRYGNLGGLRIARGEDTATDRRFNVMPVHFDRPLLYSLKRADGERAYLALFNFHVYTAGDPPVRSGMMRIGFEVSKDFRRAKDDPPNKFEPLPDTVPDGKGGRIKSLERVDDYTYRLRRESGDDKAAPFQYAIRTNSVLQAKSEK